MYITFGNYCDSVPDTLNIKIQNQQTKRVHSFKYLGIYFDFDMKWNRHIEYIINKTKYLLFIFAKLKKCIETKTLMIVYYVFVHSLINYGIVMSRFRFSISPVQVRELTLYTLLIPTPHIVIPVLGLFPQENYQGWGSRKRIYLLQKLSINYMRKTIKSQDYEQ